MHKGSYKGLDQGMDYGLYQELDQGLLWAQDLVVDLGLHQGLYQELDPVFGSRAVSRCGLRSGLGPGSRGLITG